MVLLAFRGRRRLEPADRAAAAGAAEAVPVALVRLQPADLLLHGQVVGLGRPRAEGAAAATAAEAALAPDLEPDGAALLDFAQRIAELERISEAATPSLKPFAAEAAAGAAKADRRRARPLQDHRDASLPLTDANHNHIAPLESPNFRT